MCSGLIEWRIDRTVSMWLNCVNAGRGGGGVRERESRGFGRGGGLPMPSDGFRPATYWESTTGSITRCPFTHTLSIQPLRSVQGTEHASAPPRLVIISG